MNIKLKIGKHSLQIGCTLLLWAFLCVLPIRSLYFSQTFPEYFSVPFSEEKKWLLMFLGLAPIVLFGPILFYLHKKYEEWYEKETDKRILRQVSKMKNNV